MTTPSLIGASHTITLDGVEVTFSPITLEVEAKFEARLLQRCKDSLKVMKELVDGETFVALLKSINDSYSMGQYKLIGKSGMDALNTLEGKLVLGSLVTGLPEAKVKSLLISHGAEVGSCLALVLTESLGAMFA